MRLSSVSDNLICVSKSVADELISYLKSQNKLREDLNITYIHNGADIENSVPTKGLPQDHERVLGLLTSKPSFLMVGTIEPRKGHLQTIKAFEILWQKGLDINLVIVGKEGWTHLEDSQRRTIPQIINTIKTHKETKQKTFLDYLVSPMNTLRKYTPLLRALSWHPKERALDFPLLKLQDTNYPS